MTRFSITRSLASIFLTGAFATATFAQFPGSGGGEQGGRGSRGGGGSPGGGGGGGRGGPGGGRAAPDPEMIWGFMSQGKDSINLNDPAQQRTKDRMIQQGQAIPSNGILTKAEFKVNYEKQIAARAAGGGMPGGATTMTMTPGANGQMMMSTNGGAPVPVQGGMTMGGGRGGDPSSMTDEQLKQMMSSRYELDPSGRINVSNPQNARLIQADTNRDGFVDMAEYRAYVVSRMSGGGMTSGGMTMGGQNPQGMNGSQPGGGWSGSPPGGWSGGPPQSGIEKGNRNNKRDDDEEKPVVYRFGNMPKEVPGWFEQYDTDKDGQIGLYEWRSAGKLTKEFEEYDLNGDGYITADEWLRKQKMDTAKRDDDERMSKPVGSSNASARSGMGNRGSFGSSGSPSGDGSSGRNPFTGTGGAGGPPRGDRGAKGEMASEEKPKKGDKKEGRGPKE